MLATLADRPFPDPTGSFEIKWDGVRALARIEAAIWHCARNAIDITNAIPNWPLYPMR